MNDVLAEIKADMEAAIGSAIKTYYQGEVVLVPLSYAPALMVFGTSTEVVAKSTSKDETTYSITIRVVDTIQKKFDEDGTGVIIKAQEDLIDIMEERDANGIALSTTVLGVLRRNIKGTSYLFNDDITINYSTMEQGEFFYISAEINLNVSRDLVLRQ